MNKFKLLICLVTVAFSLSTEAAEIVQFSKPSRTISSILRDKSFFLHNTSEERIVFSLIDERGAESFFSLPPDTGDVFSDGYSTHYIIRIRSPNDYIEYQLAIQKRYQIYWNSSNKRWDVSEISR